MMLHIYLERLQFRVFVFGGIFYIDDVWDKITITRLLYMRKSYFPSEE